MSITSRDPLRMAGANVHSGNANTGEQMMTRGGGQIICVFSGALLLGSGGSIPVTGGATGHAVFWSGGGRLNTVFAHQGISGVRINFYDSAVIARSGVGTIPESGYRLIAWVPKDSFNPTGTLQDPVPVAWDVPFFSGLAVSCASGCAGFTATFTPESNYQNLR